MSFNYTGQRKMVLVLPSNVVHGFRSILMDLRFSVNCRFIDSETVFVPKKVHMTYCNLGEKKAHFLRCLSLCGK